MRSIARVILVESKQGLSVVDCDTERLAFLLGSEHYSYTGIHYRYKYGEGQDTRSLRVYDGAAFNFSTSSQRSIADVAAPYFVTAYDSSGIFTEIICSDVTFFKKQLEESKINAHT